jgi:CheY-like chemotaxis protein
MISGTILYVEDNPANQFLMERIIARYPDLEMLAAESAERGLELASSARPDMILMDINLPGMDGYQALEQLRLNETTRDIPVIAVSANIRPTGQEANQISSFTDYLTKPVNIREVIDIITATLDGRS